MSIIGKIRSWLIMRKVKLTKTQETILPHDYPLAELLVEKLLNHMTHDNWLTLCTNRTYSALVADDYLSEAMKSYNWDINHSQSKGVINESDGKLLRYDQYYEDGVYPLVYVHEERGSFPRHYTVIDELLNFYNLRELIKPNQEHSWMQVDESGNMNEIINITPTEVNIRKGYLLEFMAVKHLHLIVYIDEMIYDHRSYEELNVKPVHNKIVKSSKVIFNYSNLEQFAYCGNYNSGAWVLGKSVLKYNESDITGLWQTSKGNYANFIILGKEGSPILSTCEESKLSNLFVEKPGAASTLDLSYFSKDVLDRYYGNPKRFEVNEGYINGPDWMLRVDNDRTDDLIAVTLVDLGRLPDFEQKYWQLFNVNPPARNMLSPTTYKRWFLGEVSDTAFAPDHLFKHLYEKFQAEWYKSHNWYLIKPLNKTAKYNLSTLHSLSDENEQDFKAQILALTLILIESINTEGIRDHLDTKNEALINFASKKGINLNEKAAGINILEQYLVSIGDDNGNIISLFRNLQDLRSTRFAHRPDSTGKKYSRAAAFFKLDTMTIKNAYDRILMLAVEAMQTLLQLTSGVGHSMI